MKKLLIIPLFLIILSGCDISKEGKKSIQEATDTATARAQNFDQMQDKLTAKNPDEAPLVEQWKKVHSDALHAEAKALADFNQEINKK